MSLNSDTPIRNGIFLITRSMFAREELCTITQLEQDLNPDLVMRERREGVSGEQRKMETSWDFIRMLCAARSDTSSACT